MSTGKAIRQGKGVRINSVGSEVKLCDPTWQVISRAH